MFSALPPEGRYEITVELTGFSTQLRNNLTFNAGQRAVINVPMKLSNIQETITVAGESPLVQTTSSEVSSTIDRQAFETLPVHQRNYMRLLSLDSNVVQSRPGTNAVNVGGGEVWNFGTYVDGTNNHSKWLTLQRAPQQGSGGFALETVKEVQLITNAFSVEFGGHSAGVASMITKSGTNSWPARSSACCARATSTPGRRWPASTCPTTSSRSAASSAARWSRTRCSTSPATSTAASAARWRSRRWRRRCRRWRPRPTSTRATCAWTTASATVNSLAVRYNMVRWQKDNETGGLSLPGTGFIWDNNVDTVHGMFTTVASSRFLNEVRAQYSRYTDSRAAKLDAVSINRTNYSISGGNDQGTWGVHSRDHLRPVGHGLDVDGQAHHEGRRVDHLRRHQAAVPAAAERRLPLRRQPDAVAPNPFQFDQSFALVPEARLMYPKATVVSGFFQEDWRARDNLTLNLGLRYDVEFIKDIPDWPAGTDANNFDPRVGFAWDPRGDQKWAVRGGFGRFTQQHPIFTIVKGGVERPQRPGDAVAGPDRPAVPDLPQRAAGVPAGRGAAGAQHPGDLARPRERVRLGRQRRHPAPDRPAGQRRDRRQHQPRPEARLPRRQPGRRRSTRRR